MTSEKNKRSETINFFILGEQCTTGLIINLRLVPEISNPLTLSSWLDALIFAIVGETLMCSSPSFQMFIFDPLQARFLFCEVSGGNKTL